MNIPTLADLPTPLPNRTGWPWTVGSPPLPDSRPNGSPWPRITIVTPSYNQAQFLEETIRSVLLQGYPNLEYVIMDGGSTDGSAALIERYAPWLAYWVSAPDRGQSHAINAGFERATGDWLGWLNSDDCYTPSALRHLMECATTQDVNFVAGASVRFRDGEQQTSTHLQPLPDAFSPATLSRTQAFDQPACLWRAELFQQAGPLDEHRRYAFDWAFFNRCAPLIRAAVTPEAVACYRIHAAHKTGSGGGPRWDEILGVYDQHLTGDDRRALARVRPWLGLIRWLKRLSRRYGRFGLYYGWRLALNMIRRAVIDRDPPLHPDMIALLELPYPTESRAQTLRRGAVCDGTVAGALAAFEPGSEPELS